ncbi:glycerophosphodiester phosphodiesterase [Glaciihabitans arcticus]|uniref:glycerophosphodiester phosphodiesterase n=1 Tax=Glaciihabitans arcticus TaxID=2668039 RepID=A0A4Q9GS02_9MICO|nr:glycerophosphodiester phosphodiesterase family protein [Glaciihabitans arcticus]TBN57766.1 glycerophosphodiester phosphodiesterase [Glaciihabitans arcticus]
MSTTPRTLVIAHRGASGYRPEHTRSAYELAFTLGADAVEPDIVATRDGVLVLRHENEISGTTNVAAHPEFASRKTTKHIEGVKLTGWFTEDFTWEELRTLRAVERLPQVRQAGSSFDGTERILRLTDLLAIIDRASAARGRSLVMVAEIKHATYFESIGLPLDELFAREIRGWATEENLIVECFEQTVLTKIRERGIPGRLVFLAEAAGAPADLVARDGKKARSYADHLTDEGLAQLAESVDGVSVDKKLAFSRDHAGHVTGPSDFVERAHAAGLLAFCWTLRAENRFLSKNFRRGSNASDWGNWSKEFEIVLRSGMDGVFADQPDLALAVRRRVEAQRRKAEKAALGTPAASVTPPA